ncbi:hypothetical protein LUZ60_003863 [Juncus effusus]|nr:hypothetical protein LUZ60_003863 [Juncus effusus]
MSLSFPSFPKPVTYQTQQTKTKVTKQKHQQSKPQLQISPPPKSKPPSPNFSILQIPNSTALPPPIHKICPIHQNPKPKLKNSFDFSLFLTVMWLPIPWLNSRRSSSGGRRLSRYLSSESFSSLKDLNSILNNNNSPSTSTSQSQSENISTHPPVYPDSPVVHRTCSLRSSRRDSFHISPSEINTKEPKRVIVYFTSIRAVRSTSDDCWNVLSILRGLRVSFDERDVSMDARFLAELKMLLGNNNNNNRRVSLPQVFIGERRIGGAEEVRRLHESGELRRILDGVPPETGGTCEACGGVKFVVCGTCEGSHKLYSEKMGKFRTCAMCNENGLVRCGACAIVYKAV